jgi:pyrroline-5-carboxylate reductase
MRDDKEVIAILGCGVLGAILADGLRMPFNGHSCKVVATCRSAERASELSRSLGITCLTDNRKAVEDASIVVLAVRPQSMAGLLEEIAPALKPGTLCISIAAGLRLEFYEELLPDSVGVIRAHPSPMMAVHRGYIALCHGTRATPEQQEKATELFSRFASRTMSLPESDINLFAAVFGSSSALLYLFVDAVLAAIDENSQPAFSPREIVAGMLEAASHMLSRLDRSPRKLSEEICTPNGMTIRGVNVWEEKHVSETITSAMQTVLERVKEMSRPVIRVDSSMIAHTATDAVSKAQSLRPNLT